MDKPYAANANQEPKYNVTLLIPKDDKKTLDKIKAAQIAARDKFRAKHPSAGLPDRPKLTIYDGDGDRPSGDAYGPECKGHMVITVASKDKPVLVDRNRNEILDTTEVYSGCYARVDMDFYGYANSGNKGVSAGLLGIQKLADGESLGGARGSADAFDDEYEDEGEDW